MPDRAGRWSPGRALSRAAMCRSNRLVHGWLPTVGRSGEGTLAGRDGTEWALHDGRGRPRRSGGQAGFPRRQGAPADGDRGSLRRRSTGRGGRVAALATDRGEAELPVRTAAHELDFGARAASKMLSIRTFSARISAFKSRWIQSRTPTTATADAMPVQRHRYRRAAHARPSRSRQPSTVSLAPLPERRRPAGRRPDTATGTPTTPAAATCPPPATRLRTGSHQQPPGSRTVNRQPASRSFT